MYPAEPERFLVGRYRFRAVIGRGGMGVVWQARDELLGRDVAVKEIIRPPHLDAAEWDLAEQRAQREAQMAARLSHPNVVGIYDVVTEDGRPWIIMELVPYRSLRDRVQADGPLTPAEAARVGLGILSALRVAHEAGVLHRDVKPANVLIAPEGRVVLTDFGIARATDSPVLTGTGVLVGSPSYISPERARGRRAAAPADLWALGACLYAAVEGKPPFEREGALASLTAVVTDEPDPAAHAGPLWPVISGLLRKDPDQRLGVDEVEAMLRQLAGGEELEAVRAVPEATGAIGEPAVTDSGGAGGSGGVGGLGGLGGLETDGAAKSAGDSEATGGSEVSGETGSTEGPEATGGTRIPEGPEATGEAGVREGPEATGEAGVGEGKGAAEEYESGRGRVASGRARVVLAAAAAVVVVAAVVVGLVLSSHGSPGSHRAAPPATSHSASAAARPSASPSHSSSPSPSASASASASGSSRALPVGYHRFTNSTGFSIGVPAGWQVSHDGNYVYVRDPSDSGVFLLIDQSDRPQPNALADWEQQAAARQSSYPDYHLLRLQSVSYPQAKQAADWEFTYDRDGIPVHVLNRNVLANTTHAYALYWSTPDSDWTADYHYFQAFATTFRPAA
jgi:tRNA A-37 threonylcarbamoyl transferase component Bud32